MSSPSNQRSEPPLSHGQDIITLELKTLGARAEAAAARLRCHYLTRGIPLQLTAMCAAHPATLQQRRRLQRAFLACQN